MRFQLLVFGLVLALGCSPAPTEAPLPPPEWEVVYTGDHWLLSTFARSATDHWVVGGTPDKGLVLHDSGSGLEVVETGFETPLLNWIHGYEGLDALVVVGKAGAALRYDGVKWSDASAPLDRDLWGVWGATPADTWAVGGNGVDEGQATVARDTGSGFVAVEIPPLVRPGVRALFKVWGSSANDVWMVGQGGVVLRWDGAALVEHHAGVSVDLIAVWGTGPDRVVAIGGRNNGVAAFWDGSAWTPHELAPIPGLNGAWLRGDTIHGVGIFGSVATLAWPTAAGSDDVLNVTVDLHAVHGSPDGVLSAVGGNFIAQAGPYEGVVVRRRLLDSE